VAEIDREKTLEVVRSEFQKHRFGTFMDEPLSVAQGGKGVVVPGCSVCQVRMETVEQFMRHVLTKVSVVIEGG